MIKEKTLLIILAAIQFTHITDFMIIMPLSDMLMDIFKITPAQFSWLVSAYTFSAGTVGIFAAFVVDRYDRKKVLLIAYVGMTLGTVATAFADTYFMLLLSRIITGGFGGVLGAMILSIIGDVVAQERRAGAMGIVMAAFSVAATLGVPIGFTLATKWGWKFPFLAISAFGVILIFITIFKVPPLVLHLRKEVKRTSPLQIIKGIVFDKNQMIGMFFIVLLMLGQFSVIPFITPYLTRNVGLLDKHIAYVYFFGGAMTMISMPIVGRLADRFGKHKVFIICAVLSIVPLYLMTSIGQMPLATVLFVTCLFFIFISGRIVPAMAILTAVVSAEKRGSFMSINTSLREFSAGLASLLAGWIVVETESGGPLLNYNYVGYMAILASIIAILLIRKLKMVID